MGSGLLNTNNNNSTRLSKSQFQVLTLAVGTSEIGFTLPRNTVSFSIKLSIDNSILYVSNSANGTNNPATRVKFGMGEHWVEDNLNVKNPLQFYVKSSKIDDMVQIMYWVS